MHLSEIQAKDIIDIKDGRRLGKIVDLVIEEGNIINFVVEERKRFFRFFKQQSDTLVKWKEIIKIGEDVILVDFRHIN